MPGPPFRIGVIGDLLCYPLVDVIAGESEFIASGNFQGGKPEILFDTPGTNAEKIIRGELDAALIGPIEYAQNSSEVSLYPSIGVASSGQSTTVVLCVKRELRSISTIAIGNVSASDIVLATIILSERFEQKCSLVPVIGDVHTMLQRADAALLIGDSVLVSSWDGPKLDLVDEWTDMTDLPYVHFVCAGRKGKFRKEVASLFLSSKERALQSLPTVAKRNALRLSSSPERLEEQLSKYEYNFDGTLKEALGEFFRYAFYHGILPDIPDIEQFTE